MKHPQLGNSKIYRQKQNKSHSLQLRSILDTDIVVAFYTNTIFFYKNEL